jgi:hypothetical protein
MLVPMGEDARRAIDLVLERSPAIWDTPLFTAPRPEDGWIRAASSNAVSRRMKRRSDRSFLSPGNCAKPHHKPYHPVPESSKAPQRKPLQGLTFQAVGDGRI